MSSNAEFNRIIFVDSPMEPGILPVNTLFVAMNPKVLAFLASNGYSACDAAKYLSGNSRIDALEKSKSLIEYMERKIRTFRTGTGAFSDNYDWFLFLVRFAINYHLWSIEVVLNAIDEHRPKIVSAPNAARKFVFSVYIQPEERYLKDIVRQAAHKRGIQFIEVGNSDKAGVAAHAGLMATKVFQISNYLIRCVAYKIWELAVSFKSMFFKIKRPILFTTRLYNMQRLATEIQQIYPDRPLYFLKGPITPYFKIPKIIGLLRPGALADTKLCRDRFNDLIKDIERETKLFSHRGVSFASALSKKITDNIAPYMCNQVLWSFDLSGTIARLKPSAIVSCGNRPDDTMLADICRRNKINDFFVSHGSYVSPKNDYEFLEWGEHGRAFLKGPYSFHLMQSPLGEGYLLSYSPSSKYLKTGPLIWGRKANFRDKEMLFEKMLGQKYYMSKAKIILHAGTPKSSNTMRFHIYETPGEYIQALNDLANAVRELENVILIIKFRPIPEVGIGDLRKLIPFSDRVILSVNESIVDMLGMADILVSFSSTVIEEAFQNNIPVLLYGGSGRYQHVKAYEIKQNIPAATSAVYHVADAKILPFAIKEILKLHADRDDCIDHFKPFIYSESDKVAIENVLNTEWS